MWRIRSIVMSSGPSHVDAIVKSRRINSYYSYSQGINPCNLSRWISLSRFRRLKTTRNIQWWWQTSVQSWQSRYREWRQLPQTLPKNFFVHWVILFGIPERLLTDNGPQLVEQFFNAVCVVQKTKLMTKTAYYPQTNRQAERYNQANVSRPRHYSGKQQGT